MKKFLILFSLLFISLLPKAFSWVAESGTGVVSGNAPVVITSIEATAVLKSDVLTQLQGSTQIGGAVNYASFNSGGVESFRNVTSSRDTVLLNNNQYIAWLTSAALADHRRIGLSADDVFVISADTNIIGRLSVSNNTTFVSVSGTNVRVLASGILTSSSDTTLSNVSATNIHVISTGNLRTSGDTNFVNVSASTVSIPTLLRTSADTNFVRVSSQTVHVSSGGILRSSSDSILSNVSLDNLTIPSSGLIRTSGDTVLTNVSASNVLITSTLSVSGNTSTVGGLNVRKTTVAGLPAVSLNPSAVYMVSDATGAGDCTAGGGTFGNICFSSGVGVWVDA